ncbi:FtsL-like putative cell division protein [Hymenobacter polaris]|uniref:FtsL-like putative cell division protein n=1 Tax=Hymenobacter polaris TaxID=2682546 RepID=UPI0018A2B847|nr:FtsL-like putative cell division protein [Hymenobacter polaris]
MATNTLRPGPAGPPRTNTVRPRLAPPEEVAAEPVAAPAAVAAPVPTPTPTPEPTPAPGPGDGPRRQPRPGPRPLTAEEADAQASEWKQAPAGATATGWSLFSLLDRFTGLDGLFREGLPVRYLPKLLFVMALTLLYIGNTHYGNRMNRNIQRLKQETEDLRADYTTLKSDYMEASKQSEVARKVAAIGLVESSSPPFRITVPAGRLDEAELETMPVLTSDTLAARAARDSVAAARADSVEGRVRRQQFGLPTDDTPEAGAPPPGLSPDDSLAAPNSQAGNTLSSGRAGESKRRSKANSTKKHKTAQEVQAVPSPRGAKKAASHSSSHGPATR